MLRSLVRTCRRASLVGVVLFCAWWIFAPPSPAWVESWYAGKVFPGLASILIPMTDAVPFSLSGAALIWAALAVPILALRSWRRRRSAGASVGRIAWGWLQTVAATGVIVYALFIVLWGASYRRPRLEERLGLDVLPTGVEDARVWVKGLAKVLKRNSPAPEARDAERALASLRESLQRVLEEWDGVTRSLPKRVKKLPAGSLLAFSVSGVTTPVLEAHVDAGEHEVSFLAVAIHELAHSGGICAEADADLAAAVAGLRADDEYARYAMAVRLYGEFARYLPKNERRLAWEELPPAVRKDMAEIRAARSPYKVEWLTRAQGRVYDTYLRSQGLKEGMKEYSFLAKMLIAAQRKGWVELGR